MTVTLLENRIERGRRPESWREIEIGTENGGEIAIETGTDIEEIEMRALHMTGTGSQDVLNSVLCRLFYREGSAGQVNNLFNFPPPETRFAGCLSSVGEKVGSAILSDCVSISF